MKNSNHYLKDGTKWSGNRHTLGSKIMTGKTHTDSSKDLYHLKELGSTAKKKALSKK